MFKRIIEFLEVADQELEKMRDQVESSLKGNDQSVFFITTEMVGKAISAEFKTRVTKSAISLFLTQLSDSPQNPVEVTGTYVREGLGREESETFEIQCSIFPREREGWGWQRRGMVTFTSKEKLGFKKVYYCMLAKGVVTVREGAV